MFKVEYLIILYSAKFPSIAEVLAAQINYGNQLDDQSGSR